MEPSILKTAVDSLKDSKKQLSLKISKIDQAILDLQQICKHKFDLGVCIYCDKVELPMSRDDF